jgi:ABC-type molybdate transport system substrate-binding protein
MSEVRQFLWIAALFVVAASAAARADYPVAPDVVVFCEPTLRHVVTEFGAQWRKETGIPVRVFDAPTWSNLAQIARHTRDDVIIGEGDAASAAATAQNLIKGETVSRLWQNKLVVAALAGGLEKARAASPPAPLDLASVAGKTPIAIVDPEVDEAGTQTKQGLQVMGLWDAISAKSIGAVDTADAAFLLSEGKVKLAVLYATDVAARPEFVVTETLPAADGRPIVYWAAQTQRAMSPNTAKFLDFLRRTDVRAQGRDAGLEVVR